MTETAEVGEVEDTPPATLGPLTISISQSSWNKESVDRLAQDIGAWTTELSRYLKLDRLTRIHIAEDYLAALAAVDPSGPLNTPTDNEHGYGAAMSVRIHRDGTDWTEIVIAWPLIEHFEEQTDDGELARYVYTHELAHAHEHRLQGLGTPAGVGTWRVANVFEQALLSPASGLLSEYSACRRSAWVAPLRGADYLDMLSSAAIALNGAIAAAIEAGSDGTTFSDVRAALGPVGFLYSAIGYAFGHWHGVRDTLDEDDRNRLERQVDAVFAGPHGRIIERAAAVAYDVHEHADWSLGVAVYRPVMDDVAETVGNLGL